MLDRGTRRARNPWRDERQTPRKLHPARSNTLRQNVLQMAGFLHIFVSLTYMLGSTFERSNCVFPDFVVSVK